MAKSDRRSKAAPAAKAAGDGGEVWKWGLVPAFLAGVIGFGLFYTSGKAKPVAEPSATAARLPTAKTSLIPPSGSHPDSPARTVALVAPNLLFDSNKISGGVLLSKGQDNKFRPDSDAPSGRDLWVKDGSGAERLANGSVFSARFSPDGSRIAYATTDCALRVEDLQGNKLAEVEGAYSPRWKPDGSAVIFAKVPAGRDAHLPGTLHLATLDPASGQVELLTDGRFDDVRPEFHPSGDWILFVSGGRSGLASFWRLGRNGNGPEQVTNLAQQSVDERFVPTPYHQTIWSPDGRWFVYDFKSGEREQIWGLEFGADGALVRAVKLADGLDPQWREEGKAFGYTRRVNDRAEEAVARLP